MKDWWDGINWPQVWKTTRISAQSFAIYVITGATAAGAFTDDDGFFKWFGRVWVIYMIGFFIAGGNAVAQRGSDPVGKGPH
jgi:hypothetical protein